MTKEKTPQQAADPSFARLDSFNADWKKLPKRIRDTATKKLRLFSANPKHPSLRSHPIQGFENIYEISVNKSYRITYHLKPEVCLRRIGTHDILRTP